MGEAEPIRVLLSLHQGGGAGSVNSVLGLALGLMRRGLLVRFVCPPGTAVEAEARAGGLEVHPLQLEPRRRRRNARRLAEVLARYPVDLINPHGSRDREAFTWLGLTGRLPAPLVPTRRSWPRTSRLENWLVGRVAARIIAISPPLAAALASGGVPRQRLVVVLNGLLADRIDLPVHRKAVEAWCSRIGWEASRRTVGIVSRPKDQEIVLKALRHVTTPVRVVLAGLDGRALTDPLPFIPDRHAVVRLPFDPAIRPLYELLEVVLHPSRWDALPQAVLEAMALGKPVIASRSTGNEVLIRHEEDGLLVPPLDPVAWAGALDRVLGDAELAERLGRAARVRARDGFPFDRTIDETIRVYREVLGEFRVPSAECRVAPRRGTTPNSALGTRDSEFLLAYDFPPMPGGIARALGEMARHGRMVVSTGRYPGDGEWDREAGIRVVRAPVAAARLRTIGGLVRWARSAQRAAAGVEFVWAGNVKPAGHVARWLHTRRRLPYGLIVHGLDLGLLAEQSARSPRKRLVARAILSGAAGVVANSNWTAARYRELVRSLGLPALQERVRVVPLGADPLRFRPEGPTFPLGPGRWLLTVARLVSHKGIDTGLEALAGLTHRYPDLRYAVAGEGPDRERLAAQAARLGVGDKVRFLGRVEETDLPALYRAAELYLGLSREEGVQVEGFGLSLVEAQASGRPVVAGRSGGIPDVVTDGVAGVLVPPTDPAAAAAAITALLDDDARRAALGMAGRSRVEQDLNWGRVAEDLRLAAMAFRGSPRR